VDRNGHFETYKYDIPSTDSRHDYCSTYLELVTNRNLHFIILDRIFHVFVVLIFSYKVDIDRGKMKWHNPEKDLEFIENFILMAKATPNL
jgi:hypothetical protein